MTKNYNKPYLTIPKQLTLLQLRGMVVEDEGKAAHYLKTIGYYRLSGYWFLFRQRDDNDPDTLLDEFVEGTNFQQIIDL